MRNIVAHHYGSVDAATTWEIIKGDIPELDAYCIAVIRAYAGTGESDVGDDIEE